MEEEKAGCELAKETKKEEGSRETATAQEKATVVAEAVSICEKIHTKPAISQDNISSQPNLSNSPSSAEEFSKPALSYIGLIAKVILSSPSQKLNLASIYRAMEERFPYLRSRGEGWRNSVRHNLSVNECFVKVSRCEDGRGHYWGIHPAHLKDFRQGNFRQYRKARGRREREQYGSMEGCLAGIGTNCLLGSLCEKRSGSSGWVEPQCPLQEPKSYQTSSLDWAEAPHQPWSFNMALAEFPSRMRHCYFLDRLPNTHDRAIVGRWHHSQSLTPRLHCWDVHDPTSRVLAESHDSMFMTTPLQPVCLPGCWCAAPVFRELIKPLPYKVNNLYHH